MSKDLISDQLRAALAADKRSLYAIAAAANVPRSAVCRYASGERSISLETAAALAEALGLRLVQNRRRTARKT